MNAELEALVLALDAVILARDGDEAERMDKFYQSRLDDVLMRNPGLSRDRLIATVDYAYRRWLKAQEKPSSLPPRA